MAGGKVGRKLGRRKEHRRALLRSITTHLFHNEEIQTTLPKAKELKKFSEKIITLAKRGTLSAQRAIRKEIEDKKVVNKLITVLAPRFRNRSGGYTRIFHLNPRKSDGAEMAIIKLV